MWMFIIYEMLIANDPTDTGTRDWVISRDYFVLH